MSVRTIELTPSKNRIDVRGVVAYVGAAAFAIGTAWYGLAAGGITQARAPQPGPHVGAQHALHLYYLWLATTLPQERLYTVVAIVGFCCLVGVAFVVRGQIGRDRALAKAGAFSTIAGAALWIATNIGLLGGHRAIGLMATHANPVQTVASIAFAIDTTAEALSLAAFALIGAGMAAFAYAAWQIAGRLWAACTAVVSLVMLVLAWSYAFGQGNLTDVLILLAGVAVLPAWLLVTNRLLGREVVKG